MKMSKFSEAQINFILRAADKDTPFAEVCHKAGNSDMAFYNWRKRYGGLTPSGVKRKRGDHLRRQMDMREKQVRRKGVPSSGNWDNLKVARNKQRPLNRSRVPICG